MFKVKMNRGKGFNDKQWAAQLEAAYWWAKAWNDAGFQQQVLNYSWSAQSCTGRLWWKTCKTVTKPGFTYTEDPRPTVLKKMLAGSETLKPGDDETADVTVVLDNQRGVLGWTNEDTLTQWISRWFVDSASIAELAGNRAHEYTHKLGYDHPYKSTWDRPYSVPYAIGDLVEAWVEKNYVQGEYQGQLFRAEVLQPEPVA